MADNKTKPTDASVEDYLASRANEQQRADCRDLMALFRKLTRQPPKMWGPSIVGFGRYRYTYDSGHSGEMARIGFSPRKSELVLYLSDHYPRHQALMDKLGKYRTGKSCLYIKKLSDVDEAVLEALIAETLACMNEKYPE